MNATFTTLLSHTAAQNAKGNVYTYSLVHRSAGMYAAGSASVMGEEIWFSRVQVAGNSSFFGKRFADKFDALMDYNKNVGALVEVEVVEG